MNGSKKKKLFCTTWQWKFTESCSLVPYTGEVYRLRIWRPAGGGTGGRILTTFIKAWWTRAMTSRGNRRWRANVPPAESLRWRGKELLIAECRLHFKKDHALPNGMEINYTRSSNGSGIWIPGITQSSTDGSLPFSWRSPWQDLDFISPHDLNE